MNNYHYVYFHKDPETDEIVYVGMGSKGRAWTFGNSGKSKARYGHRREDHYSWFSAVERKGLTPDQFVEIVERGLTRSEALKIEKDLIKELDPKFNGVPGINPSLSKDDLELIEEMRKDGKTYHKIGKELGKSTMTIYRAFTGQTKGLLKE